MGFEGCSFLVGKSNKKRYNYIKVTCCSKRTEKFPSDILDIGVLKKLKIVYDYVNFILLYTRYIVSQKL